MTNKPTIDGVSRDEEIERWNMPEWDEESGFGAMAEFVKAHDYDAAQDTIAQLEARIAELERGMGRPPLAVWLGEMPESNGKTNHTAILHHGDITEGITIARSEYPDRVRYEADQMRWMIGDLNAEPCILDYDTDKHSGYAKPAEDARAAVNENAEFEAWRKEQIASLVRMGYPDAAKAFRDLGSVQWVGWQARACLDATAAPNVKP